MVIKCPIDGRSFKTRQAYEQHARDSHKTAPSSGAAVSAPRMRRRRAAAPPRGLLPGVSSRGLDLLASVSVASNLGVGHSLLSLPLSPSHINPSRFHSEGLLWARWRPQRLVVTVSAAGASTTFGSICVGWDPNGLWTPSGDAQDYMRVAALRPSVTCRLWETKTLVIPAESARKWYLTRGPEEDSAHGLLVAVVATPAGGFQGLLGVNVTLEWSVAFEGADMPISSSAGGKSVIQPDAGWSNLFTTSDGSFDSDVLTFKMHAGGAMVPFSSALPGMVYTPSAGVKVPYVKADGTSGEVKYFAKVQSYGIPGLLCFATAKDASDYIRSGEPSKALPYKSAGQFVTPAIPTFEGLPASVAASAATAAATSAASGPYPCSEHLRFLEAEVLRLNQLLADSQLQDPFEDTAAEGNE